MRVLYILFCSLNAHIHEKKGEEQNSNRKSADKLFCSVVSLFFFYCSIISSLSSPARINFHLFPFCMLPLTSILSLTVRLSLWGAKNTTNSIASGTKYLFTLARNNCQESRAVLRWGRHGEEENSNNNKNAARLLTTHNKLLSAEKRQENEKKSTTHTSISWWLYFAYRKPEEWRRKVKICAKKPTLSRWHNKRRRDHKSSRNSAPIFAWKNRAGCWRCHIRLRNKFYTLIFLLAFI